MARRVHFSKVNEDKQMFRLLNESAESGTNSELRRLAIKALKKVIEEQLSARQKEYIVLYYYKGIDMPKIGEMLGVSPSTVSRTLGRARQNIMRYMKYYFN